MNVFLESAYWDPVTIARTGRALKINSDARYRFERGVDPELTLPGLEAATRMILDLCGGEASEVVQDGAPPETDRAYQLDTERVCSRWWAWTFPPRSSAGRLRRWVSAWRATWRIRRRGGPMCRARPIWWRRWRGSRR